jgi:Flp pilus assembly pilin Flp
MDMPSALKRLLIDDDAQDLAEYALLVAFLGLAAVAAFLALEDAIAAGFVAVDTRDQDLGAVTPDPF